LVIRYVGETTAKTLANAVELLPLFKEFQPGGATGARRLWAPKLQGASTSSFTTKTTSNCMDQLEKLGLNLKNDKKKNIIGGNLNGQSFLFTGSLTSTEAL
jgi:DNA ligase (NAD+)